MNLHYKSMFLSQRVYGKELDHALPSIPNENTILNAIDAFSFGFLKLNFDGKVRYWSPAAEKLTGYTAEEILNKNIFGSIPEIDLVKFHKMWHQLTYEKRELQFREYYWAAQSWFQFYAYPAEDHILIYFKDIGKKIALRKKLALKIGQFREISVFNSHEIRKSLANLIGLSDMLRDDITKEELREFVGYINRSAKDLEHIITNRDFLVKDNSEALLPKLEIFDIKSLLHEIKDEFAKKTAHQFHFRCTSGKIYADRQNIATCIRLTLQHACAKASDKQPIQLSTFLKDGIFYISINNVENIISAEELTQLHGAIISKTNRRHPLQKVALLCQKHHGSIWLSSNIAKGTTHTIAIPINSFSSFKIAKPPQANLPAINEMLVQFDFSNRCIKLKWIGHFDENSRKKNFYRLIEILKNNSFSKIISDETAVIGGNTAAVNWMANYGFPLLVKFGLKHYAWIVSKNEFALLSASQIAKTLKKHQIISMFHKNHLATKWIYKQD
ncbi:PAS domain-containing protein [Pedobacter sp. SL55]|uniref:PAS domain-containing sensor histidine kinase n=1 Tax=Pedobacter sp. SL55 TaxID=2995161 RepID=UPI0022717E5D|nr:PAS domain-containing protein [Pedobacter sp. SL55]WAC40217.1 PAS domain-containing protein [Pedobacter sp. SL55]